MSQDNDASYKLLFSSPELVRDLVLGFIPDEWLHSLDYSTLEKMPGSYVTDDLRHRTDDVVWRVKVGPEWVYLYILIEFQSKVDPWMAVRMMSYVGLLYQDLIKAKQVLPHRKLPPVLPIVLYNGDARWTAATNIADLIPKVPGLVAQFLPSMEYLLIAENQYTQAHLATMHNLVAAVMRLQRPDNQAAVLELIDLLNVWLADNPELMRIFAIWIRAVLLRQSKNDLALPKVQDLKELKMTLAARFEEWAHQSEQKGRQEGRKEGRKEGEARILQRLLVARFGPLSQETIATIEGASTTQLEAWTDRFLAATTLAEVFAAPAK
ncbi:MAG: Rpn family recombination-promoting nuclease/putative transposase [Giesbergeria sp.]|uniref:Rpn family recombination-promoting nuclease/putative transposase n=1 Tax=Giesbergeria sp. TaxID=2818473 RepID=UPI00260BA871|nr:Rpn family recombination-promoting nuclease/putative transposase [Giesbergeria sp.]MDD2609468.1 Rpn family recombination-promoting nuclease/putative transposase [Giesbergeria sp.]